MQINREGAPITEADVEAFEERHRIKLPESYREFLLRHNGGTPVPARFRFPDEPKSGSIVATFFSLNDKAPADLDRVVKSLDWPDAYELGVIRIGRDTGGSGLFLATRGAQAGQVLFVDREATLRKSKPVILADSFDGFLATLSD
jgi:hypothetical protein